MTTIAFESSGFLAGLEHCFRQREVKEPLKKGSDKAWDQFIELGLPSRQMEVYRYVKLRKLYQRQFVTAATGSAEIAAVLPHVLPECTESVLVFLNGRYQPQHSNTAALPGKVQICHFSEAIRTYGSFLNTYWAKCLKEETDPFAALNAALNEDGVFIYLPPNTVLDKPVQLLYLTDTKNEIAVMNPRMQVFAGKLAQGSFVATHARLSGETYFDNQLIDFNLEEGSQVSYYPVSMNYGDGAWAFNAVRANLKRDSRFETAGFSDGAETVRHDIKVQLLGENAEAKLNGLWMLEKGRECHTNILIDHHAPNCRSLQLMKGVLTDHSHSSFEGKIYVRQEAQKTDAFQLNNNLLLSERANAESKPNLEIFADDVKASHGATVGQLDREQLFYLKSRGFNDTQAKNLLVRGYCQEVAELLPGSTQKSKIYENIHHFSA